MFSDPLIPFYDFYLLKSGAIDLLYCSASFAQKNERWPTNYADLSAYVKASNGCLFLTEYERVDFVDLPYDAIEIRFVRPGSTNETKFRFENSLAKKGAATR